MLFINVRISAAAETVSLSVTGQPAGTAVSFSPASVAAGGGSTLTIKPNINRVPGTYNLVVQLGNLRSLTVPFVLNQPPQPDESRAPRLALHAAELGFQHPVTEEHLHWSMPLPADLEVFLGRLRKQSPPA